MIDWWRRKRNSVPAVALMREQEEELHRMVQAVLDDEPDVQQRLNKILKSKPEHQRSAFIEQLRLRLQEEAEEKAHALIGPELKKQERELISNRQKQLKKWIMYRLPGFIRSRSFAVADGQVYTNDAAMERAAQQVGHEMQEEGLHLDGSMTDRELGQLVSDPYEARQRGHHRETEHDVEH